MGNYFNQTSLIMKNFSTIVIGLSFSILSIMLVSCEKEPIEPTPPTYTLSIDSVLTEDGRRSIEVDSNGYFLLDLNPTSNQKQTVRRITGGVLKNGSEPTPPEVIDWESSHVWYTNDTIGYVIRRTVNVLGQWVNVDTIQLNFPSGLLVPTINPTSISGTNGKINTMIAPIYGMKGDTMIVTARLWTPYNKTYTDTLKIILR
jgi:hypothetical protein